jgi:O-antigen biosynthesis protein
MELANGKSNKFFTPAGQCENRYFTEIFDAEKSKGQNDVFLLASEIPDNSLVLDIGCAQGKFGLELKKKNCKVYGIDIDKSAAEYATKSGNYEKVFVMDITKTKHTDCEKLFYPVKKFDAIIFSNVLEHLPDPTAVLCQYSNFLKDNGIVLVSVPNVANMDICLNLMNGKFNYTDTGILDNTHLKFFTKSSFAEWIHQINETYKKVKFDCCYIGATFYESAYINEIRNKFPELYSILGQYENYNGLELLFVLKKIPCDSAAVHLSDLLAENQVDVVHILGETVKGNTVNLAAVKPVEGEKLWYENQFLELNQKLQQVNQDAKKYCDQKDKENAEAKEYIYTLEKELQKKNAECCSAQEYVKEIEKRVEEKARENAEAKEYIQNLGKELQKKDAECCSAQEYVKEIEKRIEEKVRENAEAKEYIKNLEKELQKKNAECCSAQEYVKEIEKRIEEKVWENAEAKEYIKNLEKELQKKIDDCCAAQEYVNTLQQQMEQAQQSINMEKKRQRELAENFEKEKQKLLQELDKQLEKIEQLENSFAGRIQKFFHK